MFSLAPYKYRHVLASEGGPIDRIECANCEVSGQAASQAVAYLKENMLPGFHENQPDGAGTHESPLVARFMAISEAIERWALRALVAEGADQAKNETFGLDVDISSNGMAAFPGMFDYQARKKAFAEAIERHCLISWWEGLLPARMLTLPNISEHGILIDNPFSSHEVAILWKLCEEKYYAFAFGTGDTAEHAAWRAGIELERTEGILKTHYSDRVKFDVEEIKSMHDIILKRVLYFSTTQGFRLFLERLKHAPDKPRSEKAKILYDGKIPGPWSRYATVWRVVFDPPTREHLSDRHDYFFW